MKGLRTALIAIILVTSGFIGLLLFEGAMNEGTVEAADVIVDINGGGDHTTIQAAVTAASPGDTIFVWAGSYNGPVTINKRLSLIGNGTSNTTIDGGGSGDVVKITADWVNVTGFRITNSGTQLQPERDAGIELNNVQNVMIGNNNCSNNNYGITLESSSQNTVINNTCFSNTNNGILLFFSDSNKLINNTCSQNSMSGILLFESHSNTLENNTCNWNQNTGIYIRDSNSNTIKNSILKWNQYDALLVYTSDSVRLENNICYCYGGFGITILFSTSATLLGNEIFNGGFYLDGGILSHWDTHTIDTSNTVNTKPIVYRKSQTGGTIPQDAGQVILGNCTGVTIELQTISNIPFPVTLGFSSQNTIANNTLSSNGHGIVLRDSNSNIIKDNNFESNQWHSIYLFSSENNTITNDTVFSNDDNGIYLFDSKNNFISDNNISSNDNNGIFLNSSDRNVITNNNIISNNNYGIYSLNSNNNKIYFNNIIDNTNQALEDVDSNNQWDNGDFEGNFWSDYTGADDGANSRIKSDGIGDTNLPHAGVDSYPFMKSYGWLYPGTPVLDDPGDFDTDGNFTLTWNDNRGTVRFQLEEDDNKSFDSPIAVYQGIDLYFQLKNKQNGTYYYRLKAFSSQYESVWSDTVNITVDWFPAMPQNFQITAYNEGNALNLTWDLNAVDTTDYWLYSNVSGSWKVQTAITHPNHTYNHTDLTDGKRYYYKVKAVDLRDQESEFSEIISGIPKDTAAPEPPSGLLIKISSYNSLTLVWNASTEDDVAGYNIYRGNILNPGDSWDSLIGTALKGEEEYTDHNLTEGTAYYYAITTFDEVPNESDKSKVLSGTTTYTLNDFDMVEDTNDYTTINLFNWVKEVNQGMLTFQCNGQVHINVTIYPTNGTVVFKPEPNWNGNETLTFTASYGKFTISEDVVITVLPVNDPPGTALIIFPAGGIEINESETLDLKGSCTDLDLAYGDELTYQWSSSLSGELGIARDLDDITFTPGIHTITLKVSDKDGETSTAEITITVLKSKEAAADDLTGIIIPGMAVIIIVIILVVIMILITRKKKEAEKLKMEEEAAPVVIEPSPLPSGETVVEGVMPPGQPEMMPPGQFYPDGTQVPPAPGQVEPSIISAQVEYPELPPGTPPPQATPQIDYSNLLEWGRAYILITKESDFGQDIFENLVEKSFGWGLCISRTHPSQLKTSMIMDTVNKIWLSKTSEERSISPTNITKIAHTINEFFKSKDKSVILLDGMEYLINNNDFSKILKFIETIHERIVLNNGILLVPVNPTTMSEKNFEFLEKELSNTIKDPLYIEKSNI
jgi:parallel beta-helix repeat protein